VTGHRGSNRVNRGGSWNNSASNVRASQRNNNTPGNTNNNIGLRPLSPETTQAAACRPESLSFKDTASVPVSDHAPRHPGRTSLRTKSARPAGPAGHRPGGASSGVEVVPMEALIVRVRPV
jgi:hypothetical protein